MSKEAMKLALEALENHPGNYKLSKAECAEYRAVEDAIREALSEQPAQRKPLTYEQRNTIISQECRYTSEAATEDHHHLIEAVELLHNIKENT